MEGEREREGGRGIEGERERAKEREGERERDLLVKLSSFQQRMITSTC